jgi:hypothetical protein
MLAGLLACVNAFSGPTGTITLLKSNLYIAATNGTTTLADGDLTQYDPTFSDNIDGLDARKMSNPGENIGMVRGAGTFVIERRHTIESTDTIFYKIWNLTSSLNYQLAFDPINMAQPGLAAFVQDNYLHTNTPVSLDVASSVNFSINADPASTDMYRFRLIFTTAVGGTLPLTFTGLKAWQQNTAVNVNWNTAAENNMKDYEVQKSTDGSDYKSIAIVKAGNLPLNNYSYTDAYPATGANYYRVVSANLSGLTKYSSVVKVNIERGFSLMRVFPNPVVNETIQLQVVNQPAGQYQARLINSFGQLYSTKQFNHPGGSGLIMITPAQNIPNGIYRLEITGPAGAKTTISVVF